MIESLTDLNLALAAWMGWRYNQSSFEQYEPSTWVNAAGTSVWPLGFEPSSCWDAAMRLVDHIQEAYPTHNVLIDARPRREGEPRFCVLINNVDKGRFSTISGDNGPLAIARAVEKAYLCQPGKS